MDSDRLTRNLFKFDFRLNNHNWGTEIHTILKDTNHENSFWSKSICDIGMTVDKLRQNAEEMWTKNIKSKTKLRTYTIVKSTLNTETYLKLNLVKCERSTLAQFRLGVLTLEIETGRYKRKKEENGSMRKLDVNERLCKLCSENEVEDEIHFLLKFPKL